MTYNEFLETEYQTLLDAADKITGRNELSIDLLHYAIEEMAGKPNLEDILGTGGARFYLVRIMMTQWRSQTGPFYRQFMKQHEQVDQWDRPDTQEEPFNVDKVQELLNNLNWYDRELFLAYVEGQHSYSSLSRETHIPRTSISLTINRVRKYLKKNL